MASYWYVYVGPEAPYQAFIYTVNYHKYVGTDPFVPCEFTGNIPCAIYAAGSDSIYPDPFSVTLQDCIANGTTSGKNYAINGEICFYVRATKF